MSFLRLRETMSAAAPAYLALTCFGLAASPAAAQDGGQEAKQPVLGGVTVTDTAIIVDGYKVDKPSSPKFTQPLRDTPQTIQIINKELFNEQGATTLTEVLRNSPGVGTFYAGENGNTTSGDAIRMRGFDTSNSIFVDGIRDLGSVSRDIFNTDAVEVQKGPAGTDNGRTAPTGAINLVSKRASLESALSGTLSVGVDGQKRITADVNQTLGGLSNSALRLNMLWQDSDVPGRDHVNNQRLGLAASLGLGLDTATRAWLNLLYIDQDNIPDGYVPTIALPGWEPQPGLEPLVGHRVDSENFYGTRKDHDDVKAQMATLIIEHDFSDNVRLSNVARVGETKQDYLLTAFMSTGANIVGNPADPDDLSAYTITRGNPTIREARNRILTNQLNLRADFATGAVEHNLSIGAEITGEKQVLYGHSSTGTLPVANLYNPDWNDTSDYTYSRNGTAGRGKTNTLALYAFDTAKFFDGLLLVTGGVRIDHYKTTYVNTAICNNGTGRGAVPCGTAPVGSIVTTADLKAKDTLFNWKLGAVLKPSEPVSLYVNYALSQQPPGGDNFTLAAGDSTNNPDFAPQKAKTIEAGVKWDVLGGALAINAAIFQTKVLNEVNAADPSDIQSGSKRVRGVELSAVGNITDAWSISAGYAHQKTKVTNGSAVAVDGSDGLTYSPDDSFSSWTSYRAPFGLEVAGGVRYTSGMRRGTDGAAGTPPRTHGYTVVDALLGYAVNDHVKLRLNAYNLFDKDYVAAINKSGYRYTPGQPQTFLFSADFRF
ncbi:TonB-dependent siderophore receptor [Sphingopyxis lindanitolerans]|uniref:TonB-dependent siderophore receptor n=1 Tax=Sphingopyxis lindanitolerans TaxID=2054227 RepID=A0A2S8BAC9_9SPHN|nr:catecholate siderophore receptor Fiu [Sphingopyxis lindanitolerans]PQM29372.1 TonB-dependent siderophore receptor [Sphingopyxis lindanitolerans]